jgi:hypothetical protein
MQCTAPTQSKGKPRTKVVLFQYLLRLNRNACLIGPSQRKAGRDEIPDSLNWLDRIFTVG